MANNEIFSHHIFMLPFLIKVSDKDKDKNIDFKKKLLEFYDSCGEESEDRWVYKPFPIPHNNFSPENNAWEYNEFVYFYDYVNKTLFNNDENPKRCDDSMKDFISLYFEKQLLKPDSTINISNKR